VTFPDGRRYVLVGDAAYSRDAVESGEPQGFPWIASWPGMRWRASARSRGAPLLLAHDAAQWRDVRDVADVHTAAWRVEDHAAQRRGGAQGSRPALLQMGIRSAICGSRAHGLPA
jgi:hypothetical protein